MVDVGTLVALIVCMYPWMLSDNVLVLIITHAVTAAVYNHLILLYRSCCMRMTCEVVLCSYNVTVRIKYLAFSVSCIEHGLRLPLSVSLRFVACCEDVALRRSSQP